MVNIVNRRGMITLIAGAVIGTGFGLTAFLHFQHDRNVRMTGGEILSIDQAEDLTAMTRSAVETVVIFASSSGEGVGYEQVSEMRMRLQSVSLGLKGLHYSGPQGNEISVATGKLEELRLAVIRALPAFAEWERALRQGDQSAVDAARMNAAAILQ